MPSHRDTNDTSYCANDTSYLIFDCECDWKYRIFEVCHYLLNENLTIIKKCSKLIINQHIPREELPPKYLREIEEGKRVPWAAYLTELVSDLESCHGMMITHKASHDSMAINVTSMLYETYELNDRFRNQFFYKQCCSMKHSQETTKLPPLIPNYKYPTLEELYYHCYGDWIHQEHRAESDVQMLVKCVQKLEWVPILQERTLRILSNNKDKLLR